MNNIIKYLFLSFICSVFTANAQQIHEADKFPVYKTEGSTMATSSVDGETLLNRSSIDPANTLFGRLNGLTVLQNSDYTIIGEATPTLYIRGLGSINNNSILVLVDGMERSLNTLVTEEIKDISILKDAPALALYGLKGANGVLLVTTKRGNEGKVNINASYQHGFTKAARLPKFADAVSYAQAVNEGLTNEGFTPRYSPQEIEAYKSQRHPFLFPDVNWMNETLRDWGQRDQINFTAKGGTDKARFFSLINFISDRGLIKKTNLNPSYSTQLSSSIMNIRTNMDLNITKSTLMQLNLLGRITEMNEPGSITSNELMYNLYNVPANAYPVRNENDTWGGGSSIYPQNPVAQSSSTGYCTNHYRGLFTDLLLKQDLNSVVEGLNIEAKIGFDASSVSTDERSKQFLSESVTGRLNSDGTLSEKVVTQYGQEDKELGFVTDVTDLETFYKLQFRLNYNKKIGDSELMAFLLASHDKQTSQGQFNTHLHEDLTAFGHYALKDRYYFDLTLSTSGSSRLPKGNQWGFLPATGVAWRLSQEDFLKNTDWLNELKLRASFGLTGNDRIIHNLDAYPFVGGNGFLFKNSYTAYSSMVEGHLPSNRVAYEKTRMLNIGIESQLFKKLSFNIDVFSNSTYDIMVTNSNITSSMLGAIHAYEPDGKVKNKGMEVGLNLTDQIGKFKYNIGGLFSYSKNEIVKMNEAYKPYDYLKQTGRPIGQPFGMEVVGIFEDHDDIDQSPKQMFSDVFPGDYKYKDQNNDGRIDDYDAIPIGYNINCPELYFSVNIDLKYKRLGLNALFQGVGNYSKYLNTTSLYFPLMNNRNISEHYLENYWKPGGDNSNAKYPRLTTTENNNNYRINSVYIADASYFKLRSAELFYRLPQPMISRFNINNCKIFVKGMDLFTIDKIKVTDPEDCDAVYPVLQTFHVGMSVVF